MKILCGRKIVLISRNSSCNKTLFIQSLENNQLTPLDTVYIFHCLYPNHSMDHEHIVSSYHNDDCTLRCQFDALSHQKQRTETYAVKQNTKGNYAIFLQLLIVQVQVFIIRFLVQFIENICTSPLIPIGRVRSLYLIMFHNYEH